jgi:uracil-DNA glycosylase
MSDSKKIDPRLRRHLQALKRAGVDYVAASRFSAALPAVPTGHAAEPDGSTEPDTQASAVPTGPLPAIRVHNQDHPPPSGASWQQHEGLKILADVIATCTRCPELVESRTRTVFADGSHKADVCFIGEAPGGDEDATGVPFVGRAGQLLTRVIENGFKMSRQDVFICNVVKCRPEGNRNPTSTEMTNCQGYLIQQLEIVQPKVIVALGKHALAFLLGQTPEKTPISKLRGRWHEYRGIPVMPTWHPAYILRQGDQGPAKREMWEDVKEVLRRLGRRDEG